MKPDAAKEEHLKGDLRPPLPPGTTIPGEDTALVRDGQLILVGSATAAGITYVCREVYALK